MELRILKIGVQSYTSLLHTDFRTVPDMLYNDDLSTPTFARSVNVLLRCMKDHRLAAAIRQQQMSLNHRLPLGSYLLKPVQRVLKYHLLLQVSASSSEGRVSAFLCAFISSVRLRGDWSAGRTATVFILSRVLLNNSRFSFSSLSGLCIFLLSSLGCA